MGWFDVVVVVAVAGVAIVATGGAATGVVVGAIMLLGGTEVSLITS